MKSLSRTAATALFALSLPWMPAQADKLIDPIVAALPPQTAYADARTALLNTLEHRDWVIVSHSRGILRALRVLGQDREVIIEIRYDARAVSLHYLDSANLSYRQEGDLPTIDGDYVSLVNNIVEDIQDALGPHKD